MERLPEQPRLLNRVGRAVLDLFTKQVAHEPQLSSSDHYNREDFVPKPVEQRLFGWDSLGRYCNPDGEYID